MSHSLFEDDTLIFCKNSKKQFTFHCWLLMWFEALSGLKIDLKKNERIPIGDVEALALELGCKVGNLPTTCLGLLLGARYESVGARDGVEECFIRRLAMWKRQYISKSGRATLIRSTLSSMLVCMLFLFHIPRSVETRLDQI